MLHRQVNLNQCLTVMTMNKNTDDLFVGLKNAELKYSTP